MAGMANFFSWAYLKSYIGKGQQSLFRAYCAWRSTYGSNVLAVDDTGLLENFLGGHYEWMCVCVCGIGVES